MAQIDRNMIIKFKNEPHIVLEKEFYSPGKGGSFTRARLKNLKSGKVIWYTFRTGEQVEELNIETQDMKFLYTDSKNVYFMDPNTFEQISAPIEIIKGGTDYLHTDAKYIIKMYEGNVIAVQLPVKIKLVVTETTDATKGGTVTNATKEAVFETGAKIQVPMFVKNGDKIVVNTETDSYVSKAV